ncbi:MAG: hypothetical protein ABJG41_18790 [Cyclobacteriaceae bacterium]
MTNHNIYLQFTEETLKWSSTEGGEYVPVGPGSPTTTVGGTDTITFIAGTGIDKIQKISDGKNGTKKMLKSKKGEDTGTVVVTIIDKTIKNEIDSYSIKFKPTSGGSVTVDPDIKGNGAP